MLVGLTMSASAPRADIVSPTSMSGKCRQEAHAPRQTAALFDHLVGAREPGGRHGKANRTGCFQIDHQFEFCWLLDRDVAGLGAAQNPVHEVGGPPELAWYVRSIGHQTSGFDEFSPGGYRGHSRVRGKRVDVNPVGN